MGFGELLRRLRGIRSQREVADALGMPVTTLSTLENQQDIPRGPVLKRLCEFYGVPPTYFYRQQAATMKDTSSAKAWLQLVRDDAFRDDASEKEAIAFSGPLDISDTLKKQISAKLKEKKNAEAPDVG